MSSVETGKVDGRTERTAQTYRRILAVTRELILAGKIDPTAREIAAEAEITTRTLFRHFTDMESLHRSLIEDAEVRASAVMDEPFPVRTGSHWQDQMQTIIDRRVRVYESLFPLYISTIWSRYRASKADAQQRGGVKRRRKRLKEVLPGEISGDQVLFEAVDAVLGIEYWISLRRGQQLSVSKATRVLSVAIEKLTAPGWPVN